jgi:3-hydroxyisobutyrate dehydrogenase-like beta-hydroxyacid dehydrogenase
VRRLLDVGHRPYVADIDRRRVEELERLGALGVLTAAEAARRSVITLLSLPTSRVVEDVVYGHGGILEGARRGHTVIDLSSSEPRSTRSIGEKLAEHGIDLLDAPVSRGAQAARDGTLSILVGGDVAVLERCRPILELLGTDIIHVGPLGTGHAAKALNNHMSATTLLAAIEGFILAARAGVDPALAVRAVNQGSGSSHMSETRFPRYYLPRHFDSAFALGLMHKDCRIAADIAQECSRPMLLGVLTGQIYQFALNRGMAMEDNTRILEVMELLLGARLSERGAPARSAGRADLET